ncbi:MAG TPA: hypothetical protein VGM63_09340 [Mucilaginibacter sp.]|jgi:error-prone DNA polymerase
MITGKLRREGLVTHVVAKVCQDYSGSLNDLSNEQQENIQLLTLARGDEKSLPPEAQKIAKSRNFK